MDEPAKAMTSDSDENSSSDLTQSSSETNEEPASNQYVDSDKEQQITNDTSPTKATLLGKRPRGGETVQQTSEVVATARDRIIAQLKADLYRRVPLPSRNAPVAILRGTLTLGSVGGLSFDTDALLSESTNVRTPRPEPTTLTNISVLSRPTCLDIVDDYRGDDIPALSERLHVLGYRRKSMSRSFSYKAAIRGKIPLPGYVLASDGKIWHQLATSRFIVFCTRTVDFDDAEFETSLSSDDDSSLPEQFQSRLKQLVALSIQSILFTSAGARNPTSDPSFNVSVRSVIVLQTIREMLHWRHVIRAMLSDLPTDTACELNGIGQFSVAQRMRLRYQGETNVDISWLDPTNWKDITDLAFGLVAWVNVPTTSLYKASELLRDIDVTKCNSADWSRVSLQFSSGRNLDQSIAFVNLIRFLVVRHHVPMAGDPSLLCANEFLDRSVAIPELEACLPEILNVRAAYPSGHDIDTGAVTAADLVREQGLSNTPATMAPSTRSTSAAIHNFNGPVTSAIGLRGLPSAEDRRVVMSVWTSPITGSEWKIPEIVTSRVDFTLRRAKYQLSVTDGEVSCKRIGLVERVKSQVRGITQIQFPFVGIQREASCSSPEASGSLAITNALSMAYGEEACRQMLAWLHRGAVNVRPNCVAASFVPRSSHVGDIVANQRLCYEICRQMVFGRRGHELYWIPGDGLPSFRVRDCPNGTYNVTEIEELPPGVELCRAELSKDFG